MAQIPQDFNGMITFMNINSDQQSSNQDNNDDAFKKTGGSTQMRGTMISLQGGAVKPSNGSCNNSIVLLRSESNYVTSDFANLGSPRSTQ